MTGFIVSVFPFRNRVSSKEAFEGLELGEGKLSRPVLRGPGGRKAAWLLGSNPRLPRCARQNCLTLGVHSTGKHINPAIAIFASEAVQEFLERLNNRLEIALSESIQIWSDLFRGI